MPRGSTRTLPSLVDRVAIEPFCAACWLPLPPDDELYLGAPEALPPDPPEPHAASRSSAAAPRAPSAVPVEARRRTLARAVLVVPVIPVMPELSVLPVLSVMWASSPRGGHVQETVVGSTTRRGPAVVQQRGPRQRRAIGGDDLQPGDVPDRKARGAVHGGGAGVRRDPGGCDLSTSGRTDRHQAAAPVRADPVHGDRQVRAGAAWVQHEARTDRAAR